MTTKGMREWVFVLVAILAMTDTANAMNTLDERRVEVSMRLIGHEILLSVGDSTSRVLPIEREADRYKIAFESDFELDPDKVVSITDSVMQLRGIASSYLVEVEQCETGKVVHAYEMNRLPENGAMACGTRRQPRDCYTMFITLLDGSTSVFSSNVSNLDRPQGAKTETGTFAFLTTPAVIIPVLLLIGLLVFFFGKRGKPSKRDEDLISIGKYCFDKRNMRLSFGDEETDLTSKEADLLYVLHTSANDTLEREVILKSVWGDEGDYVGRTLDVFISKLRKKLEADPGVRIANVRGVGYKLILNEVD